MSSNPTPPAPLTGIRVLDFTHVLAGPFCTRLLADLGADVVRVESSKHPDHPWPSAYISKDGRHASYLNTNRSKRSIAIDLKNDAGRTIASRLAAVADVVIENFSAGVMERLRLDYTTLQRPNPGLIYVSMSGYGHDGPRREWTSMNMNLQGYSGLMMVTGSETDPPTAISNSWNDYIGGLHACFGILQAVDKRKTSGKGARIDLSQFECSASMIGPLLLSAAVNKTVPLRRGNRSAVCAPQGVYHCAGRTSGARSASKPTSNGKHSYRRWERKSGDQIAASAMSPAECVITMKSTGGSKPGPNRSQMRKWNAGSKPSA